MSEFLTVITAFPTVVWTVLLGVCLVLWILTLVGAMGMDAGGDDGGIGSDHGGADGGTDGSGDGDHGDNSHSGSWLEALGLGGVPINVLATLLALKGWLMSALASFFIMPAIGGMIGGIAASILVLVVVMTLAVWLTGFSIRPLRPAFVIRTIKAGMNLIGKVATITSSKVTGEFGTATFIDHERKGNTIDLNVICRDANDLGREREAVIVDYLPDNHVYVVAPLKDGTVERTVART